MSTTDLVLLTPNLSPSCPKCSSQCISQTTQALCFLKKQTWQCEGKKFLALIPYLFKCSSCVHCHEWDRNGWKMKTIQARLSSWLDDSCQQPGVRHPLGWKPSADSKPNEYRWTAKTNTRFLSNPYRVGCPGSVKISFRFQTSWLDDSCRQLGMRHPLWGKPLTDSKPNKLLLSFCLSSRWIQMDC